MLEIDSKITCDDKSLGSEILMDIARIGMKETESIPFISGSSFNNPISESDIIRIESGKWTMMSLRDEIGNYRNFFFRY